MSLSTRTDFSQRLTEKKNCLSFDCGLKNLAYCFIEDINDVDKEFSIRMWETFSLRGSTVKDFTQSLYEELSLRAWMTHVDHVVIEAQVSSNNQMKVISHILQMYFLCKRDKNQPTIHFISPKSKFKVTNVPDPQGISNGHAKNKKIAVEMAKKVLMENKDKRSLEYLFTFRKQDDLADSFLQGLYFLRTLRSRVSKKLVGILEMDINEEVEESIPLLYKAEDCVLAEEDFNIDSRSLSSSYCFRKQT
jgi:hypothetical protein